MISMKITTEPRVTPQQQQTSKGRRPATLSLIRSLRNAVDLICGRLFLLCGRNRGIIRAETFTSCAKNILEAQQRSMFPTFPTQSRQDPRADSFSSLVSATTPILPYQVPIEDFLFLPYLSLQSFGLRAELQLQELVET